MLQLLAFLITSRVRIFVYLLNSLYELIRKILLEGGGVEKIRQGIIGSLKKLYQINSRALSTLSFIQIHFSII